MVVTEAHLSSEFGLAYWDIEEDGYLITSKIEMLISSDTPVGITKSMGVVALLGFADFYDNYRPDIVVILESLTAKEQFVAILSVIDDHKELSVIFTKANAETGGRIINRMIDEYVEKNKNRCAKYTCMGQLRYLSALRFCDAVMGNSSSGLAEVPSFKIPTVDIGDRQRGRVCAQSVIHCGNSADEIDEALQKALSDEFRKTLDIVQNPYEKEGTSDKIMEIIRNALDKGIDMKKIL